jgi:hypothetical protein
MSRDIQLKWNKPSLQNLIVRRIANNKAVTDLYGVDKDAVLSTLVLKQASSRECSPIKSKLARSNQQP